MTLRRLFAHALAAGLMVATTQCKPAPKQASNATSSPQNTSQPADTSQPTAAGLAGTSWRLVKFQSSDGTILKPDDKSKYTISFGTDGRVNARIDCNRGTGTWKSSGPSQLEFGPLALTRMACPPGSIDGKIVKQLPYVRSYVIKDGQLFLSLMADGGIFEFEPAGPEQRRP